MIQQVDPRVAIVTGAVGGIGRAVTKGLSGQGYEVFTISRREWPAPGGAGPASAADLSPCRHYVCDLANERLVEQVVRDVAGHRGRIDCLVNTAGVLVPGGVGTGTDVWTAVLRDNFIGPSIAMRHVLPHMTAQRAGHVINVCSVSALEPSSENALYSASKAALLTLTKATQRAYAAYGIRVCAISPGWVDTPMAAGSTLEASEMLRPEDVSLAVSFLLSLSSSAVVHNLILDCVSDL
jgi:NAD(P)-dependent dehydrogenase (short-subunit alcohol dehydrogenase family)